MEVCRNKPIARAPVCANTNPWTARRCVQKQNHSPRAPMPAHNHHANDNTKLTTMNIALNIPLGEFPLCDTIDKRFANMV